MQSKSVAMVLCGLPFSVHFHSLEEDESVGREVEIFFEKEHEEVGTIAQHID